MIGMILTGHGHFATGLASSVELIAGKPEKFYAVDFTIDDTTETLEKNLMDAIEGLKDCDGIVIFTDLVGGSPFKTSAELSIKLQGQYNIQVVSGTNLGGIIESVMSRNFMTDPKELAESALEVEQQQLIRYEFKAVQHEEPEDGDGI